MTDFPSTLAIDYGTKRVGLARSFGTLAEPWQILSRGQFPTSSLLCQKIAELVAEERIKQIVVGISEQEMAAQTVAFVEELKSVVSVPVHLSDETLSSQAVKAKLHEAGKLRKNRRTIDHFAAAEILSEWMETREL